MPLTCSHPSSSETPQFSAQETYGTITCEGTTVVPTLDAKVEKGFFFSGDHIWTCYRRNYFAVNVSYGLSPWISNSRLYLDQGNGKKPKQIQSMAVSLAAIGDSGGKTIELIQYTHKRNKGPRLSMKKELLAPTPPRNSHGHCEYGLDNFHPHLPLQKESDCSQQSSPTSHGSSSYQHGFERIQFKSATANNGNSKAQQQYYHLIVELWANIQSPGDNEPKWFKVAARSSYPVVVRGRSPAHYQHEGPHNASASRGAGGSGLGGSGHHSLGSNGARVFESYSNGPLNGSAKLGGNLYRGTTYSLDSSPIGSHLVDTNAPLYKNIPAKIQHSLSLPQRIIDEYLDSAALAARWDDGGCEWTRGHYPDMYVPSGYLFHLHNGLQQ
ncbi:p53-like transcription factor [Lizonia empirigonia]|nr:p53-like transcription factor [Lizonia empirigonia]